MQNKNNCFVCGKELVYQTDFKVSKCVICHKSFDTNVECRSGHYICDTCHSASANQFINAFCINSTDTNPIIMAEIMMKHPSIKMHGPEHHFLVPAVLLTAYYNKNGKHDLLKNKLDIAEKRAKNVLGGFCGFYGSCGAAMGTGIFISLITDATPLSRRSWGLSNMATANSLKSIAEYGGPRCCKRDTFLALIEMIDYLKYKFDIELEKSDIKCSFTELNKECIKTKCPFYLNADFIT